MLYYNLLTSDKLQSHFADVEEQAQDIFERLTAQMAKKQGVTEILKVTNMMAWVRRMNNIRNCAEEIICNTLIYS